MIALRALALAGLGLVLAACTNEKEVAGQQAYRHGFEAIGQGDWLKAQEYLTQAKAAFPKDPYVLLNLGVVAQRLGRFDEARGYYQQVIDQAPDVVPQQVSDPAAAGKSLADLARDDLATLPPS
ncbi:MAG TPA: tetratricopeptide repeat protein [Aliidongia sp.]|nr:tetratricopeptide repeat protein [Aliidongia sp.]